MTAGEENEHSQTGRTNHYTYAWDRHLCDQLVAPLITRRYAGLKARRINFAAQARTSPCLRITLHLDLSLIPGATEFIRGKNGVENPMSTFDRNSQPEIRYYDTHHTDDDHASLLAEITTDAETSERRSNR